MREREMETHDNFTDYVKTKTNDVHSIFSNGCDQTSKCSPLLDDKWKTSEIFLCVYGQTGHISDVKTAFESDVHAQKRYNIYDGCVWYGHKTDTDIVVQTGHNTDTTNNDEA